MLAASRGRIGWHHRNVVSPWKASLELQKIDEITKTQSDPLLNLTLGAILPGDNWGPGFPCRLHTGKFNDIELSGTSSPRNDNRARRGFVPRDTKLLAFFNADHSPVGAYA